MAPKGKISSQGKKPLKQRKDQPPPLMERYTQKQLEVPSRYEREEMFLAERAKIFADRGSQPRAPGRRRGFKPPAASTVGHITELVERILEHTDLKTILVSATRVSTTWNLCIYNSVSLQEKLFFKPISQDGIRPFGFSPREDCENANRRVFNPILVDKFGPVFFNFGPHYTKFHRAESFFTMPWTSAKIHEVVEYHGNDTGPEKYRIQEPKYGTLGNYLRQRAKALEDRRRFTRRGASWRRMLVTQPPPPRLGCMLYGHSEPTELTQKEGGRVQVIQDEYFIGSRPWRESRLRVKHSGGGEERNAEKEEKTVQGRINGARMGKLYDVVSVICVQSGRQARFWRILWTRPETVRLSKALRSVRNKMIDACGFIIEMHDEDFLAKYPEIGPDPCKAEDFHAAFLCQDTNLEQMLAKASVRTTRVTRSTGEGLDKACHNSLLTSIYPCSASPILLPPDYLTPFDLMVANAVTMTTRDDQVVEVPYPEGE